MARLASHRGQRHWDSLNREKITSLQMPDAVRDRQERVALVVLASGNTASERSPSARLYHRQ